MEFVLPAVAWGFQRFMQKHRKWTARSPLSARCFLIAQAGFFICCTTTVGLFWGITILLKFHVPSRDFFLQSFAKFHCLWKCWRCLTYLPKMNLFPWTVFLPDGFENGIIQRFLTGDYMAWGSISLFARFLEKENPLETLIVIYENVSPKGFSDWIWRISKFPFDGKFSIFTDSRS